MVLPWYRHCHKLHEIKNYFVKTKPVRILSCGIAVAALRKENVFKKDGKLFSNKDHLFENIRQKKETRLKTFFNDDNNDFHLFKTSATNAGLGSGAC